MTTHLSDMMYKLIIICAFLNGSGPNINKYVGDEDLAIWQYVHGQKDETLHSFTIPDFNSAVSVRLPHRLTLPNSVFWYRNNISVKQKSYCRINADDGAQMWVNGKRVTANIDGLYPIFPSANETDIIIRVLNNAVAGGLRSVILINESEYNLWAQNHKVEHKTTAHVSEPLMNKSLKLSSGRKDSLSFSFWGDSQGGWDVFRKITSYVTSFDDDFTVGLGDLVSDGSSDSQWHQFREALKPLAVKMPVFLIPGNHDYDGCYDNLIAKNYQKHILGDGDNKTYYDFKAGDAHFMALDPNCNFPLSIDAQQKIWMDSVFNSSDWKYAEWRFVIIHQPPYGQGWEGYEGDYFIRSLTDSLAEKHKIDFFLSGHIHDYERLTRKYGNQKTTFIVSGGAGGTIEPHDSNPVPVMDKVIKEHHYCRIVLSNLKAQLIVYNLENNVIDQYTIHK